MRNLLPILFILTLSPIFSQTYPRDYNWFIPYQNNSENVQIEHDPIHGRIFTAGAGNFLQEKWPSFVKLDNASYSTLGNRLELDGDIEAVIPDGQGGFFIAGKFTKVNNQNRSYLAQIDANNQLTSFNPLITYFYPPNATISTLKIVNNSLLVGGRISTVNGQSRTNFAAFDVATGALLSWAPNPNGTVNAIEQVNNKIVLGGTFTTSSGVSRNSIASYDLSFNLSGWNPNPNGTVNLIKLEGQRLYVAGYFTTFAGQSRSRFAEIDTNTFAVTTLNPGTITGLIYDIARYQNKLYIGGTLTNVNGSAARNFFTLDLTNNAVDLNLIQADSAIRSIDVDNGNLFLGGQFTIINNQAKKYFVEYNLTTGTLDDHQLGLNKMVVGVAKNASSLVLIGRFDACKLIPANNINCFNDVTGQVLNSPIQTNGPVQRMSIDGRYFSLFGNFSEVNGLPRNKVAIYDLLGDSLLPFNLSNTYMIDVNTCGIQVSGEELYIEGNSYPGHQIIAIPIFNPDSLRSVVTAWWDSYSSFGGIRNFEVYDSLMLISGIFRYLNADTRAAFGIVNVYTRQVHPLDLGLTYNAGGGFIYPGHSMYDAVLKNDTVFVSGHFNAVNGTAYNGVIAVDLGTNVITQIVPQGSLETNDIDLKYDQLRITAYQQYYEYNLSSNSLTDTVKILNNNISTINQFGSKLFATNPSDFGVYNTCENKSVSTVSVPCSYTWNGTTYTTSGYYQAYFTNPAGCDSVAYLDLTIENSGSYREVYFCGTQYTSDNDSVYTQSGLYNEVYTNSLGCDSVVHLNFHIYPTYETSFNIVENSTQYIWVEANDTFTVSGEYTHVFQSVNGCDSTVHLNLYFTGNQEIIEQTMNWVPNGIVTSIVRDSIHQEYYLTGAFDGIKHTSYGLNLLDQITGLPAQVVESAEGNIYGIESDLNGGYYIYGDFTKIGDSVRQSLAHLDNNFQVTSWVNQTQQTYITEILVTDSIVVAVQSNAVFSINRTTGLPDSLHFVTNGQIRSLVVYDGKLLVGGTFSTITSPIYIFRRSLVEFDLNTGALTSWDPGVLGSSSSVNAMVVNGNLLYVAGSFTQFMGFTSNNLAKVSVSGGVKTRITWTPGFSSGVNGEVYHMEELGSKLIIAGNFTSLGTTARKGLAMVNKGSNAVHAFNPQGSNMIGVSDIKRVGSRFYLSLGSTGVPFGTTTRNYLASFDTTSLTLTSWNPNPSGMVNLNVANGLLFASGNVELIGFVEAPLVAKFNANTDELINWKLPIQGNEARTVAVGDGKLFVSGTIVQPFNNNGLRVFDMNTTNEISLPNPIYGGTSMTHKDLVLYNDGYVYLANYTGANGISPPQSALCRLDVNTLDFDQSFNLQLDGGAFIKDMTIKDDKLFFVGGLDSVMGVVRRAFAGVDLTNNTLLPHSIQGFSNPWHYFYALELVDNGVIISGLFDTLYGQPNHGLVRFNFQSGQLENWTPIFSTNMAYQTYAMKHINDYTYVAGDFNWFGPNGNINGFCSFQDNNPAPKSFDFQTISEVYDVEAIGDKMHIVGDMYLTGNVYHKIYTICNNRLETFDTIYNSTSYVWYGNTYSASGQYYHHVDIADGCDSMYVLNLVVYPTTYSTLNQVSCNSFTWPQNGQTYLVSGAYSDTIPSYYGADSVITLNLSIVDHFETVIDETSCEEYFWSLTNQTYVTSGTYLDTLTSTGGCDSIVNLNLTINYPTAAPVVNQVSCQSYIWSQNGVTYTVSGMYYDTIPNAAGCDSIITLNLTINHSSIATDTQTACDSYIWPVNGQTYTISGQYVDTIPNTAGCDSIITLDLIVSYSSSDSDTQTACGSFLWAVNGQTYTTSGQYIDTIPNAGGCDSIITLDLTIIPELPLVIESTFSIPSDANSCVGKVAIDISGNADFELDVDNGSQVVTSSGYSLITNLCAGIHDLHVTDHCGDTVTTQFVIPVDSNYVFNNPFIDSLAVDSLGATVTNCDIYYAGIDTAYIDSIWTNGNTVNVIWNIVDSNGSNFDTTSYVLNNGNGVYWLQLSIFCPNKSVGEYFTVTESIYFNNGSVSTAGLVNYKQGLFEVYPNPTNKQVQINFSGSDAELTVYDLQGKIVLKDKIQNQETISLEHFERGVYLFDFRNSSGQHVQRVVKQ